MIVVGVATGGLISCTSSVTNNPRKIAKGPNESANTMTRRFDPRTSLFHASLFNSEHLLYPLNAIAQETSNWNFCKYEYDKRLSILCRNHEPCLLKARTRLRILPTSIRHTFTNTATPPPHAPHPRIPTGGEISRILLNIHTLYYKGSNTELLYIKLQNST